MTIPQELDVVKIVKLKKRHRPISGSESILRQPQIGDTGTIVDILGNKKEGKLYTVENISGGGLTTWLADFSKDEFEVIHSFIPSDNKSLHQSLIQAVDGEIEWVERLLEAGANPNGMPIIMAIQCDQPEIVEMLIENGAEIDQTFANTTPLVHAVSGTRPEIVELLILCGADVNKMAPNGFTPVEAAKRKGRTNATEAERALIIDLLKSAGARE